MTLYALDDKKTSRKEDNFDKLFVNYLCAFLKNPTLLVLPKAFLSINTNQESVFLQRKRKKTAERSGSLEK